VLSLAGLTPDGYFYMGSLGWFQIDRKTQLGIMGQVGCDEQA
jgi:hypothetical protein